MSSMLTIAMLIGRMVTNSMLTGSIPSSITVRLSTFQVYVPQMRFLQVSSTSKYPFGIRACKAEIKQAGFYGLRITGKSILCPILLGACAQVSSRYFLTGSGAEGIDTHDHTGLTVWRMR